MNQTNTITLKDFYDNDEAFLVTSALKYTNRSIFLTGKAGTGKTTLVKLMLDEIGRDAVVLAPTGMAAKNIGGQTIHSFFKIPPQSIIFPDSNEIKAIKYSKRFEDLIRSKMYFLIDEISMVPSFLIDCIDFLLKRVTGCDAPFGGKQMLFIGDPFQLPPVIDNKDRAALLERYASGYFFDAVAFMQAQVCLCELTNCYRQTDATFMEILDGIRCNALGTDLLDVLNSQCYDPSDDDLLVLTTTNAIADTRNQIKLNAIDSRLYTYTADIDGKGKSIGTLAPFKLQLKKGAQVMFVKNNPNAGYVNGTIGVVEFLSSEKIEVRTEDDILVTVERASWEEVEYSEDKKTKELNRKVTAKFTQYPLIPAWAITVHKSQGLTIKRIHLDNSHRIFDYGQLYVALSRCTTLEGLSFSKPIQPEDIRIDRRVLDFYKSITGVEQEERRQQLLDELLEVVPDDEWV